MARTDDVSVLAAFFVTHLLWPVYAQHCAPRLAGSEDRRVGLIEPARDCWEIGGRAIMPACPEVRLLGEVELLRS